MANVKLKIRNGAGTGWDLLHPETNVEQISDAEAVGKALLRLAAPTGNAMIKVLPGGTVEYVAVANIPALIGASPTVHTHTIAQITNLTTQLAAKADLSGGKIQSTQMPSWILGGLKYVMAISESSKTIDATFLTALGASTNESTFGRYAIVTADTCILTLAANYVLMSGDEGDTTSTVTLEKGDWIVYRGHDNSTFRFDIINNTYQHAGTGAVYGIVGLTSGSATSRVSLSSSSSSTKVVDEAALRSVMKDIIYADTEPGSSLPGDLLIEY